MNKRNEIGMLGLLIVLLLVSVVITLIVANNIAENKDDVFCSNITNTCYANVSTKEAFETWYNLTNEVYGNE